MKNTITVVGVGRATRMPDTASFRAVALASADEADEAYEKAVSGLAAIVDALRAAGATDAELTTRGVAVWEQWEHRWFLLKANDEDGKRMFRFGARGEVNVELDDVERASKLALIAVKAGAAELSAMRYGLSDWSTLVMEALRAATDCAWESAETLAMASDRTLGTVLQAKATLEDAEGAMDNLVAFHCFSGHEPTTQKTPVIPEPMMARQEVVMTFELV
jgi:hypothetical protein